jgi:hypothetical protein
MKSAMPLFLLAFVAGCADDVAKPYYAARVDPEISGFDVATEPGNLGGATVTLQGTGFGSDPNKVVVLLGNHNAEIVSVTDTAITIVTPTGPLTGGPVDVVVTTPSGYTERRGAYTYDVRPPGLAADPYLSQQSYIIVENLWTSCYGGMYANPEVGGCEDIAYIGQTGISGVSEWYNFSYPRIQTTRFGWFTGADYQPGAWQVTGDYDLVFPSFVDNLRREVGKSFTLTNSLNAGDTVCIDPELDPADNEVNCSDDGAVRYDRGTLEFCEGPDPETGGNFEYVADWPVKSDFFEGEDEEGDLSPFASVDVDLAFNADDSGNPYVDFDTTAGVRGTTSLTLPGSMLVKGVSGFTATDGWAVGGLKTCLDADEDGQATLDEAGLRLSWEPIPTDIDLGGADVKAVGSYVHVSVSYLPLGWFGLTTGAPRASVIVPDDNEYDAETGMSHVSIPNSVMYQFPTPNFQWSSVSTLTRTGSLGSYDSGAAYMLVEIYRVTDFAIPTEKGGNLVFSYVTGDLSFMSAWKNPMQADKPCGDCADGDGDGWTDAEDPDCNTSLGGSGQESGFDTSYTCNDGIDNNSDGLTDRDDPLCDKGWSGETTCTDGLDNDEDGWLDDEDADCTPGDPEAQEDGRTVTPGCSNGLDDDGDGWADADDPGCLTGAGDEDDGFTDAPCNDGVDNDGHGDIDALDPYCAEQGALAVGAEVPEFKSGCADGKDSEASATLDGYIDAFDPDCEYKPSSREYATYFEVGSHPVIPACYDGIDNDGDGSVDGADASCWRGDLGFTPDGFLADEGAAWSTPCSDGADSDADGWIDGLDPDCVAGSADTQTEDGFGTTVCNDGLDNNGDGKIDSESSYCKSGRGTFEGP